ncbi:MAG: sulfatase [Gemmatimonadota bacterium]
MKRYKVEIRYGLVAGILLLAWVAVAWVLAPRLIRSAYAGESFGFVNDLLQGRAVVPLDRYLGTWAALALRGTLWLLVALLGGLLLVSFRTRFLALRRRFFQAEPTVPWTAAVGAAAGVGLVLGAVEVGVRALKYHYDRVFFEWSNPDALWMIPTSEAALFALLALGYAVVLGWPARRLSLKPLLTLLVAMGAWSVVASMKQLGIHPAATAVLALGLGFQAAEAAGRDVRRSLRQLRTLSALVLIASVAAVVWLHPLRARGERQRLAGAAPATARGLPNVLLIVLDTVRAQSMGLYGYGRPNTPTLARLADQGTVFDRAYTTAPWTLPSHAALFTGRWHHELSADWLEPLDQRYPTLAEFLGGQGYETGGFVANLLYTTRITGLDRGFHVYRDHPVSYAEWIYSATVVQKVVNRVRALVPGGYSLFTRKVAADVNEEFLQWVDTLEGRPFFGFLNYFDAHDPYEQFEPHTSVVRAQVRDSVAVSAGETRKLEDWEQNLVDRYDGSIHYMDAQIGLLLDSLDARGLLSNTLVVVVGDHGDQFFEHGLEGHSNSLYQMLTHVPLLAVLPGRVPAGLRVASTVSIRDVPATVADLLGRSGPAPFAGSSLRRTWDAESGWTGAEGALTEVNPYPLEDFDGPVVRGPMKSVNVGPLHYIRYGDGVEEVYDVEQDPGELSDLSGTERGRLALPSLRQAMRDVMISGSFRAPTDSSHSGH